MTIDPVAILATISDLSIRLIQADAEVERLRAENAALLQHINGDAESPPPTSR